MPPGYFTRQADPMRQSTSQDENAMSDPACTVLFVCLDNSARSILAEAILNYQGQGLFKAYSAAPHPKPCIHPYALHLLRHLEYPTAGLEPKSWHEFAAPHAPGFDYIFTLCDVAASKQPPCWPGRPILAFWSLPDPAAVIGKEAVRRVAFLDTFRTLTGWISVLIHLREKQLKALSLVPREPWPCYGWAGANLEKLQQK